MTIAEVMSEGVQTVRPGTPATNARERMKAKRIHHLLVKEGAELVGVLSARDLGRGARRGDAVKRIVVADFMTPRVVTVPPTVIEQCFKHPLTDIGLAKFLQDAKKIPV